MGAGMTQVGALLVLTVVVLPCFFFTLLALLDRFERSLSPEATRGVGAPEALEATRNVAALEATRNVAGLEATREAPAGARSGADVVPLLVAVTATVQPIVALQPEVSAAAV